jgi:cytoskeletal protein CcmA (bactofilin family)
MFGRSDPKTKEPMKLPNLRSPVEPLPESGAKMDNDLDLSDVSRPADVQLRRLPSFPEDKHERPAPPPQGKHEGHVLVGEGIKIVGEIRDCRKIEIYGVVEGDLEAEELIVHGNGLLKGNVKTDRAQIHGSIDGDITVTHLLDVKSKGSVAGRTQYGELSVETGGRIVGTLDDRSARNDDRAGSNPVDAAGDRSFKASATA